MLLISYNGARFIKAQVESILKAIDESDEIIISDDGSTDGTIEIIELLQEEYNSIKLVHGNHEGIASNFSNAYKYSDGDIVFFSDQDDEWLPNKAKLIKELFSTHPETKAVMHDAYMCNYNNEISDEKNSIFRLRNPKHGVVRNIIKSTYYGCCMAFRREFIEKHMPLPKKVIAYDQFLGLCAENEKCACFIYEKLIKHRLHGSNQSHHLTFLEKIRFRIIISVQYIKHRRN